MLIQAPELTALDPRFEALRLEAYRRGWPERYRNDLHVHDRDLLAKFPEVTEFIWVLRESGTHLYPKPDTKVGWEWVDSAFKAGAWESRLLYHYQNGELRGVGNVVPILTRWFDLLSNAEQRREKQRPILELGYGVADRIAEIEAHAPEEGLIEVWRTAWERLVGTPLTYDPTRIYVGLDFCPWSFTFLRESWRPREGVSYPANQRLGEWKRDYNGGLIYDSRSRSWTCHT
jgi:hypothetical protein